MSGKKQVIMFDISVKTILKVVLILLVLSFLYSIRKVVGIFIISVIFASIMTSIVKYFKRKKIPRSLSVIFIYFIILLLMVLAVYLIVPIVSIQISNLAANLPEFLNRVFSNLGDRLGFEGGNLVVYIQKGLESLSSQLSSLTSNIYNLTLKLVGGIVTAIMIFVLAFYLTIEENAFKRLLKLFVPYKRQKQMIDLVDKIQKKMGLWLGGQLILCLIIFILTFIILLILGIDNALTLALINGILEIIPYFGPIIGGAVIALVAFSQSFWLGVLVIIAVILIQQVENHILVPKVMQKVTGLSPVVIILAILIGVELFSFIGIIIAVPIAVGISVILQEFFGHGDRGIIYKNKV